MATCAHNVVLVGDPQQLGQVLQGTHPDGTEASVLEHLLAGQATIPPDRGLFLERTFRLHPDVCDYISEEFYERRLLPDPVTSTRTTPFGTGLRYLPVEHEGNRQESPEEAEAVRAEIARLVAAGVRRRRSRSSPPSTPRCSGCEVCCPPGSRSARWTSSRGRRPWSSSTRWPPPAARTSPAASASSSRATGSTSPSRARSALAYLVCSPRLLEVDCRTIPHMRLANALCRFVELSQQPYSP